MATGVDLSLPFVWLCAFAFALIQVAQIALREKDQERHEAGEHVHPRGGGGWNDAALGWVHAGLGGVKWVALAFGVLAAALKAGDTWSSIYQR